LTELTPAQKSAIQYVNGPLLVLAGAGSGKTSLLIHKIAWLIREYGVAPRELAVLTFTHRAAAAMRRRVAELINGQQLLDLSISTFHSLGLAFLRTHLHELGYRAGVSIYDPDDSQAVLAKLVRVAFPAHIGAVPAIQRAIAEWKRRGVAPEIPQNGTGSVLEVAACLYPEYERRLLASNAMDVDDLVLKPMQLLRSHGARQIPPPLPTRYLLVDEYEETTACQHDMVRLLTARGAVLTAAGDDDQSIFEHHGARPDNLVRLRQDLPAIKIVKLEQNFRSSGRILKAANSLIAHNPRVHEKLLWSDRDYGQPLRVIKARTEEHEAERIVADLVQHKYTHGTEFRQYAVMYRHAAQIPPLERALRERRVPYHVSGDNSFFDRTEVKDVLGYLRLLCNPADDNAFMRIVNTPRRDIDRGTLDALTRHAAQLGVPLLEAAADPGLDELVAPDRLLALRGFTEWLHGMLTRARSEDPIRLVCDVLAQLHYEDWLRDTCNDVKIAEHRMHQVMQLLASLQRLARQQPGDRLCGVLTRLTLVRLLDLEGEDAAGDAVVLATVHAAKGAEFDHIYMVGMEHGLFPAVDTARAADVAPERRLAYVAITRARVSIAFTLAERRRRAGEVAPGKPSLFLAELPQDDIQWDEPGDSRRSPLGRADAYLANLRNMLGENGAP